LEVGMTTKSWLDLPQRSDESLASINITREHWDRFAAEWHERERRAPTEGSEAPDFALPRLEDRAALVRLAAFRGVQPVALIFGSYT
jgi:hypothetical protein